jgi:hypothetical protein
MTSEVRGSSLDFRRHLLPYYRFPLFILYIKVIYIETEPLRSGRVWWKSSLSAATLGRQEWSASGFGHYSDSRTHRMHG